MRENFAFWGPATLLYGLVYVFCTFKNPSGITYPIFVAISLLYFCTAFVKLKLALKKRSIYHMVSIMLLGISAFCTDDQRIIMMNKTGIFLLVIVFLLEQFCDTTDWNGGLYIKGILSIPFLSLEDADKLVCDGAAYCRENNKVLSKKVLSVLAGIIIAVPLLMLVLALLCSADLIFGKMMNELLLKIWRWEGIGNAFKIIFRFLVFSTIIYAWMSYLSKGKLSNKETETKYAEPIVAITVTGMLSVVYIFFCGLQVVYLFFGKMTLPAGYTYAGYAREGFFQLLAVSILNLLIVLICLGCVRRNLVLKMIMTVMSLCTIILIISSSIRMIMYIRYYFLTFLRVFVLWSLAVLFVLFIGVLLSIWKTKFALFRYILGAVVVFYLAFSFSHPDYYIAKINLANAPHTIMEKWNPKEDDFFQSGGPYRDYEYLKNMSADAALAVISYMEEWEGEDSIPWCDAYLTKMERKINKGTWRNFNLSRYVMKKAVEKHGKF